MPARKPVDGSLKAFYLDWIEDKKPPLVRKSLARDYRQHFNAYIVPELGTVAPVESLSYKQLVKFRSSLIEDLELSVKTCRNIIDGSMRAMYRSVWADNPPAKNPFEALEWPDRLVPPPDPFTEEQPGRILHELRRGEMARAGEIPHVPYFGTVDATPLWLVLLHETWRWTGDDALVRELLPHAERALDWIERYGDLDGDGFVEYARTSPKGLVNQGWKDSGDGVPLPEGGAPEPPIALVEVQGYCLDARRRMARLYRQLGRREDAARCAIAAQKLARRLDEAFWMEKAGTYALALDGEKRQVQSVGSNAGHLLFSRAVPEEHARRVARVLMSPESFSGFGIRTLARGQRPYNPLSYHNGTIWPHDNSLIAMGLSNYGMQKIAAQVLSGAYDACRQFRHYRLPELYCGMGRGEGDLVVSYPVSCSPQAWASGAFFLMLRGCLGLYPDAPRRRLKIVNPHLPPGLQRLTLERLRVGDTRITVDFTCSGESCFASVRDVEGGPLAIRIEVGAQNES